MNHDSKNPPLEINVEKISNEIKELIKNKGKFTIIYLDDEAEALEIVQDICTTFGFESFCTTDYKATFEKINQSSGEILAIISDLKMPHIDGFEFRKKVLEINEEIPFFILSGFITTEIALRGIDLKISGFIDKPIGHEKFTQLVNEKLLTKINYIIEDRELRSGFIEEAKELIQKAEEYLLILDQDQNDLNALNSFFGIIHTLKGSSAFFDPKTLHAYAHRYEDLLKKLQNHDIPFNANVMQALFSGFDIIKDLLSEFVTGNFSKRNLPELYKVLEIQTSLSSSDLINLPATQSKLMDQDIQQNSQNNTLEKEDVRVSVVLLDEFMQLSGEVTVIRNMLNKCFKSIERRFTGDKDVSMLGDLLEELHKINSNVQNKMSEIRKIPLKSIFKPIPRALRDVSKKLKKEVELKIIGDHIRVDTSIAEVLNKSLLHLVKNSLDHGLEYADERKSKNKPTKGTITINCLEKSEEIWVEISDDGKGLDQEAIKNKLIKNGTHSIEQINALSEDEIYAMIFSSGFSTAAQVTDISGRGVGMSMVKDSVDAIGGRIQILSTLNFGACFRLILPVPKSVMIASCLSAKSGGQQFGFMQDDILRVIHLDDQKTKIHIREMEGSKILSIDNILIPITNLNQLFSHNNILETKSSDHKIIILESQQDKRKIAVEVDEILDVEDTVIKSIHPVLNELNMYKGVTFLDEGSLGIILDSNGLLTRAGISKMKKEDSVKQNTQTQLESQNHLNIDALLFSLFGEVQSDSIYALNKNDVFRLEKFSTSEIQQSGHLKIIPYREMLLELIDLSLIFCSSNDLQNAETTKNTHSGPFSYLEHVTDISVIVIKVDNQLKGFVVKEIMDMIPVSELKRELSSVESAIAGHFFYQEKTITLFEFEQILSKMAKSPIFREENQLNSINATSAAS